MVAVAFFGALVGAAQRRRACARAGRRRAATAPSAQLVALAQRPALVAAEAGLEVEVLREPSTGAPRRCRRPPSRASCAGPAFFAPDGVRARELHPAPAATGTLQQGQSGMPSSRALEVVAGQRDARVGLEAHLRGRPSVSSRPGGAVGIADQPVRQRERQHVERAAGADAELAMAVTARGLAPRPAGRASGPAIMSSHALDDEAHAVARPQQGGRFGRRVEKRQRRAADQLPAARRHQRIDAGLLAADADRAAPATAVRGFGAARRGEFGAQAAHEGEAREKAEQVDHVLGRGVAPHHLGWS